MKKLSDFRADYQWFSGKASDVARQLSFAGIALIWIFKIDGKPIPIIPEKLLSPAVLFILTLTFDLLQYSVASLIWGAFARYQEKKRDKINEDPVLSAPKYYNWPSISFFWAKLIFVFWAYALIFKYVFSCWST